MLFEPSFESLIESINAAIKLILCLKNIFPSLWMFVVFEWTSSLYFLLHEVRFRITTSETQQKIVNFSVFWAFYNWNFLSYPIPPELIYEGVTAGILEAVWGSDGVFSSSALPNFCTFTCSCSKCKKWQSYKMVYLEPIAVTYEY